MILLYVYYLCWLSTFEFLYRMVGFRGGKSGIRVWFRGFCKDIFVDLKFVYGSKLYVPDSVTEIRANGKYSSHGMILGYSSRTE